jgi:serine/threonine protein kinase
LGRLGGAVLSSKPDVEPRGQRYETVAKIASGGMATVYVGVMRGVLGFRQLVAIKRPHPHLSEDPSFRSSLLMEAKLASLVRHANVVDVRDVEVFGDSVQLVMDYVEGASLAQVMTILADKPWSTRAPIAVRMILDACAGLHAIHETADEAGQWLGLVHYDVSPQNILVGVDGVTRVTDFGIAKSARLSEAATAEGTLKGKFGYMAPELVRGRECDRRADVFSMGVVLWEGLAGKRLFRGDNDATSTLRTLSQPVPPLATIVPELEQTFDDAVTRATSKPVGGRFKSMHELAAAVERAAGPRGLVATNEEVARFIGDAFGARLEERRASVRERLAALEEPRSGASTLALPESRPADATEGDATRVALPPLLDVTIAEAGSPFGAATSQVSSISVSTNKPPTAPPDARLRWIAAAAGLVVVGGLVVSLVSGRQGITPRAAAAPTASVETAEEPETTVELLSPPADSASPGTIPSASSGASTTSMPTRAAGSPRRQRPCTIRSYVDGAGIKHFVRDCK